MRTVVAATHDDDGQLTNHTMWFKTRLHAHWPETRNDAARIMFSVPAHQVVGQLADWLIAGQALAAQAVS